MSATTHWVHDWDPIALHLTADFGIRWYGLAYLAGFLGAALMLHLYARAHRSQLPAALISDFIFAIVMGVMVGGRLGYFVFYNWGLLAADPLVLLRVWEGGMASHGGFIGVTLALLWFARQHRLSFLHLGDLIVSVAPLGLLFGRIANFINGELWGKVSDVRWAVIFPSSAEPGTPLHLILPRHPSQLYEAALEGLVLFIYLQLRFWRSRVVAERPGRLAGEFLLVYALGRIVCEFYREPDAGVSPLLGLSRGSFYSLFCILAGLWLILRARSPAAGVAQSAPPPTAPPT